MVTSKRNLLTDLHIFLGIVATLIVIGFVFIYSSSSVYALEKFSSSHYFAKRQLIGLVLGLLGLIVTRLIPINAIKRLSPFVFLTSLALTAMTRLPAFAVRIHGSSRWLRLPGLPAFQPGEMLKLALIIYVAYFIAKKG